MERKTPEEITDAKAAEAKAKAKAKAEELALKRRAQLDKLTQQFIKDNNKIIGKSFAKNAAVMGDIQARFENVLNDNKNPLSRAVREQVDNLQSLAKNAKIASKEQQRGMNDQIKNSMQVLKTLQKSDQTSDEEKIKIGEILKNAESQRTLLERNNRLLGFAGDQLKEMWSDGFAVITGVLMESPLLAMGVKWLTTGISGAFNLAKDKILGGNEDTRADRSQALLEALESTRDKANAQFDKDHKIQSEQLTVMQDLADEDDQPPPDSQWYTLIRDAVNEGMAEELAAIGMTQEQLAEAMANLETADLEKIENLIQRGVGSLEELVPLLYGEKRKDQPFEIQFPESEEQRDFGDLEIQYPEPMETNDFGAFAEPKQNEALDILPTWVEDSLAASELILDEVSETNKILHVMNGREVRTAQLSEEQAAERAEYERDLLNALNNIKGGKGDGEEDTGSLQDLLDKLGLGTGLLGAGLLGRIAATAGKMLLPGLIALGIGAMIWKFAEGAIAEYKDSGNFVKAFLAGMTHLGDSILDLIFPEDSMFGTADKRAEIVRGLIERLGNWFDGLANSITGWLDNIVPESMHESLGMGKHRDKRTEINKGDYLASKTGFVKVDEMGEAGIKEFDMSKIMGLDSRQVDDILKQRSLEVENAQGSGKLWVQLPEPVLQALEQLKTLQQNREEAAGAYGTESPEYQAAVDALHDFKAAQEVIVVKPKEWGAAFKEIGDSTIDMVKGLNDKLENLGATPPQGNENVTTLKDGAELIQQKAGDALDAIKSFFTTPPGFSVDNMMIPEGAITGYDTRARDLSVKIEAENDRRDTVEQQARQQASNLAVVGGAKTQVDNSNRTNINVTSSGSTYNSDPTHNRLQGATLY